MLVAALLFGTTGTAQELGPDDATPLGIGAVRLLIGATGLLVAAMCTRAGGVPGRRQWGPLVVAGCGVAGYQIGFFAATERAGVALGTLVALGSGPVFTGLYDSIRTRRWPPRVWSIATALAGTGVGLVAYARSDDAGAHVAVGVGAALLAGLAYAVFSIASKRVIASGAESLPVMAWVFSIGAVLLAPLLFVEPMSWLTTARGAAVAVHLGLGATTLAYALFGYGLARLVVPSVVTLTLFEPATAAVLSVVVLDQALHRIGWAGVAMVMAGVAMVATARSEPLAE